MTLKDFFRPPYRYIIYLFSIFKFYSIKQKRESVKVLNSMQTVDYIMHNNCSISRFGDGEISLILKWAFGAEFHSNFQDYNSELAQRLSNILRYDEPIENHIVGLPSCGFSFGTSKLKYMYAEYWNQYMYSNINNILKLVNTNHAYCDTNFTRFYMDYSETTWCKDYVEKLKELWKNRNVIFVEGEKTRLGAGNDLFSTAATIRRILCPSKNAFEQYENILNSIHKNASKDDLIIIALGMTATLLAYDLAKDGYQALDLGHIDIEYEWFLMGAKEKVAITGKFTNESPNGKTNIAEGDNIYLSQIIDKIL